MKSFKKNPDDYAVVTGASSGIGKQFCRALAKEGYNIVMVARREEKLRDLASEITDEYKVKCEVVVADLSKRKECKKLLTCIDSFNYSMFINCAGFGDCGFFLYGDLDKELAMINVNIRAVHILTKGVLRHFVSINRGYLLNVASSAGLLPAGPYMATYYASKSYVTSFSQAVSRELKNEKKPVYVGVLCPGPVDTEFNYVANVKFSIKGISAQKCVEECIRKMKKQKTVILPGLSIKLAVFGMRFLPNSLCTRMIEHQQKRKIWG